MDIAAAANSSTDSTNRRILSGGTMARWLAPTAESRIEKIPTDQIHSRRWLPDEADERALRPLRVSITRRGIVEPLLLRPRPTGGFEVIAGERRLAVARELSLSAVPAIVRDMDEAAALVAVIWGVSARRPLSPDERRALQVELIDAGVDADEARSLVGEAAVPKFTVTTTAARARPLLSDMLAQRAVPPRLFGLITANTEGLLGAARAALTEVLGAIDPRPLVPPR